ncbi:MAG: OmpA family protein, partial [Candidatus Kapaibacterium sp.]
GFGYTVGLTSELPVFASNAVRIGAHYYTLSTQSTAEQVTNCGGTTGKSGLALFQTTYKSVWTFASADILIRQLLFSKSFYLLFGGDISYLIADRFDATQRIISSDTSCQYYTMPEGKPTGRTDLSVNKQTSNNLYNPIHYSIKFGCGMFISLGNNFFLSPEVQVSYPLQRLYTDVAESVFDLNHSDIPRLWHADLLLSFRYAFPLRFFSKEEKRTATILNEAPIPRTANTDSKKELILAGKIKNCNTGAPVIADLLVSNLDSGTTVERTQTNIVGSFTIPVRNPGRYSVTATARGYLFCSVLFDLSDTITGSKAIHDVLLCREGEKIRLLVFFDYDKAELQPSSFPELDRAARLVKESPTMTVEIAGYTDSKGSEEYNQDLSERRANAVRTYLLSKNIDAERIVAKGYGKKNPVASNETETGRAENRRVEFVIVKP